MKVVLAIFVFFLALGIGTTSVAEESHTGKGETCGAGKDEHCEDKAADHGGAHGAAAAKGDWTPKRLEQVAAVLPEKQPNKAAADRPERVKLISPKFLARVSGATAKLEWIAAQGAKAYHVQVSKDAGFNNRSMYVADQKMVEGTTFDVSNLEPGVKYFWRVAAYNGDQDSSYTKSNFVSSAFQTQ